MKSLKLGLLLLVCGGVTLSSFSQSNVYSINVVGYYNRLISPGNNLIANQLFASPDNSINTVLQGVADGATFTKWDAAANNFLPLSVFSLSSHTWSINYNLNLGEGALLHSPSFTTNTFVGGVVNYTNIVNFGFGGQPWSPNYADGLHLIACPVPVGGSISMMFDKVTGRAAQAGESVSILNEASQTYLTTTFDGFSWDNDLNLNVGQAAWFNLGPVNVPEPSTMTLAGVALGALLAVRRRR
ncbi:MAG: PEP-CTERM sorting domain-containing protein [Verrucomicrobiota bacterium]